MILNLVINRALSDVYHLTDISILDGNAPQRTLCRLHCGTHWEQKGVIYAPIIGTITMCGHCIHALAEAAT